MRGHATRRGTALTRAATWCKERAPIFSHFYRDDSDQRTIADRATRHTTHIPATCGRSASIRNGKSRVSLSDAIRIAGRAYFDPAFRLVRRSSVCPREGDRWSDADRKAVMHGRFSVAVVVTGRRVHDRQVALRPESPLDTLLELTSINNCLSKTRHCAMAKCAWKTNTPLGEDWHNVMMGGGPLYGARTSGIMFLPKCTTKWRINTFRDRVSKESADNRSDNNRRLFCIPGRNPRAHPSKEVR
jgi:hypothetical protein